ncbi:hypothetical protein P7L95_10345 [Bisgaard Taxon 10/6]|uniref:hypothetical protein n=1 Tax=Exercitatus varius TaxID=67857 RepID=UPI00294B8931|nr:hypothetical protein [Exercitatus varius]MDG2957141.1 hypothetical protein [Exercitatus varius]
MTRKYCIKNERELFDIIDQKTTTKDFIVYLISFLSLFFIFLKLFKPDNNNEQFYIIYSLITSIFFSLLIYSLFISFTRIDKNNNQITINNLQKILDLKENESIRNAFEPSFYDGTVKKFIQYSYEYKCYVFLYRALKQRKQYHIEKQRQNAEREKQKNLI